MLGDKIPIFVGAYESNLKNIRNLEKGILFLREHESRGHDTKFSKEAQVVITQKAKDIKELKQMLGRGSRADMKIRGTYYVMSYQTADRVILDL